MSTDIIRYQTNKEGSSVKVVQSGALRLFLAITLPMMVITFAAWYIVYWWVHNREKRRTKEIHLQ